MMDYVDFALWDLSGSNEHRLDLLAAENGDELAARRVALTSVYSLATVTKVVERMRELRKWADGLQPEELGVIAEILGR